MRAMVVWLMGAWPTGRTLRGLQGQCMQWELAVRSFEGAARLLRDEDVAPPLPEPRGGANRLSQLASLNLALARFQTGDAQFAVARTKLLLAEDPAYWDARAALAAFLWDQVRRSNGESGRRS